MASKNQSVLLVQYVLAVVLMSQPTLHCLNQPCQAPLGQQEALTESNQSQELTLYDKIAHHTKDFYQTHQKKILTLGAILAFLVAVQLYRGGCNPSQPISVLPIKPKDKEEGTPSQLTLTIQSLQNAVENAGAKKNLTQQDLQAIQKEKLRVEALMENQKSKILELTKSLPPKDQESVTEAQEEITEIDDQTNRMQSIQQRLDDLEWQIGQSQSQPPKARSERRVSNLTDPD